MMYGVLWTTIINNKMASYRKGIDISKAGETRKEERFLTI